MLWPIERDALLLSRPYEGRACAHVKQIAALGLAVAMCQVPFGDERVASNNRSGDSGNLMVTSNLLALFASPFGRVCV